MSSPASFKNDAELLHQPIELPYSERRTLNRLVKVAMYESLADFGGGLPNQNHFNLYKQWSRGGWGMVITGNVQVDQSHLTLGRDMIIPQEITPHAVAAFRQLASAMGCATSDPNTPSSLAIVQLSHAGRQSPRIIGGRSFFTPASAPSSVPLLGKEGWLSRLFHELLFPPPNEMGDDEVEQVIERFVVGAKLASDAGFDGVQIHCSHGYLIAQFLSNKTNRRGPPYGPPNQLHLIHKIITRIRQEVPKAFVLGVKLNAADYMEGGVSEDQALGQLTTMASWGLLDFMEVSGGDYEQPSFMMKASPRQAFFSRFSRLAVSALPQTQVAGSPCPSPVIMLTGSLRTRSQMAKTIGAKHAHLIGLGRPAVLYPDLPHILLLQPVQNQSPTLTSWPSSVPYPSTTSCDDDGDDGDATTLKDKPCYLIDSDSSNNTGLGPASPITTEEEGEAEEEEEGLYFPNPPAPPRILDLPIRLVGAGFNTAWFCALMLRIGKGEWSGIRVKSVSSIARDKNQNQKGTEAGNGAMDYQGDGEHHSTRELAVYPSIGTIRSMWDMWVSN